MKMSRTSNRVIFILMLNLAVGSVQAAPDSPMAVVIRTVNQVIGYLTDEKLKTPAQSAQRRRLIEETIGRHYDYEEMAKRTLARHWRTLTDQQKTEFVDVFKTFLARIYANKIEGYAGEQIHYLSEQLKGAYAQVRTKVVSNKVDFPMDYRLLKKPEGWYVYDVVIDGVSLVRNYRDQFDRIIRSSSYEDLVKNLREKSADISPL